MLRKTLLLILFLIALTTPIHAQGMVVDFLMSGLSTLSEGQLYGGKVYAYAAGTTTPKSLYTNVTLTTLADVPVVLDSDGRAVVYGSGNYKFVITDQFGTTIFTADNVEVNSVTETLGGSVNPFGVDLTQTNLNVTNLIASDAEVVDLLVTASASIDTDLDMLDNRIINLANASDTTDAVNFSQLTAYVATLTATFDNYYTKTQVDAFPATVIPLTSADYAGTLNASEAIATTYYRSANASGATLVVQSIGTMEGTGVYSVGVGVEKSAAAALGWASATTALIKTVAVASYPSTALEFTFDELTLADDTQYRFIIEHSSTAADTATFTTVIQIEQE